MLDFTVGLILLIIILRFLLGEKMEEDPKKKLLKAQKDCPVVLYDVVFDECSPEGAYITSYPTKGLYIAWAGDYIPVEEVGQSAFATLEEAEKKLHTKLENLGAKERSMVHDL